MLLALLFCVCPGSEEDDFGSHKRRPSIKVKEEDKDTLNATSSVASTNPSSGYGDRFAKLACTAILTHIVSNEPSGTGFRFNNQSDSQELTESQKIERRYSFSLACCAPLSFPDEIFLQRTQP